MHVQGAGTLGVVDAHSLREGRTRRPRRVRDDVRDGVAVMAFSAVASTTLALVLVALVWLAE